MGTVAGNGVADGSLSLVDAGILDELGEGEKRKKEKGKCMIPSKLWRTCTRIRKVRGPADYYYYHHHDCLPRLQPHVPTSDMLMSGLVTLINLS